MTIGPGMFVTPSIRLSHPLGEGGMGEVWVADHLTLDRKVAVKLIRDFERSDTAQARFELEAKAAARIQNPHVVQIFDYGIASNGQPFITMELLSGESLDDRIARGPVPAAELATILVQTASALMTAHESGVVHRDIKPPNIFLVRTPSGEPFVKLLDFGIAKVHTDPTGMAGAPGSGSAPALTRAGVVMGTPDYMSPEQLVTTNEITFHADIWSLGVVAHEALIGQRPFSGRTVVELCISISEARYERHRIPAHFLPWFDRALAIAPGDRFPTVMVAAEQFRQLAMVAPSAPLPPQPASFAPAHTPAAPKGLSARLTWSLAAIGCVLGAVIAVMAVRHGSSESSVQSKSASIDEDETERSNESTKRTALPAPQSAAPREPAPTATYRAPPSRKSGPPSSPPVSSRCKVSCRDVGACGDTGSGCVVRSSADCRQSNMCSQFGKCSKTGSSCGATSAADCAASRACKSKAHCGLHGNRCYATTSAHCRQSSLCSFYGKCTLGGAYCVPGSDADCKASTGCTKYGKCAKNGASCAKR